MNKLLLSTLTALSAFALVAPAQAGVLLPHTYAAEFCSLRDMGVDRDGAIAAAARAAYVDGDAIQVTVNGRKVDVDVLQARRAVSERCPQHM